MTEPDVVEHLIGVYLLYCENPKYKGRVYIGYTVDPVRRLKRHNAGAKFGGAWKTSKKGPWNMILIVHGFPNSISALRFEWAWQHPDLSRRLRNKVPKKKTNEKKVEWTLKILSQLLQVGPWCRLPLSLRWLDDEFGQKYSSMISPPLHMPIVFGKITARRINQGKKKNEKNREEQKEEEREALEIEICDICYMTLETKDRVSCLKSDCPLIAHIICLAEEFKKDDHILPIDGNCPNCQTNMLWGDIIRKKIGCNLHLKNENPESSDDSE